MVSLLLFLIFHSAGPLDLSEDPPSSCLCIWIQLFAALCLTLTGVDQAAAAAAAEGKPFALFASLFSGLRHRMSKQGLEHSTLKRQPLVRGRQLLGAALKTSARLKK